MQEIWPMVKNSMKKSELIKQKAISLGFSACGISQSGKLEEDEVYLKNFLEKGFQGNLKYLETNFDKRVDTSLLVEGSKSVISVLINYYPGVLQEGENIPLISKYAYGEDYHPVIKEKLYELLNFINKEISPAKGRAFVDSAPILEKARAVKAGLGWIGKNGLLINKELGSFLFIGELIVDIELEYDEPFIGENCGSCTKCIEACPTSALAKPHILNASKCLSYLTNNKDVELNDGLKEKIGRRIYCCDTCQDVCPWNKNIKHHNIEQFMILKEVQFPDIKRFKGMDEEEFNRVFDKSAIKWIGYDKFRKNILFVFPD